MFLLFMKLDRDNLDPFLRSWSEVPVPSGQLAGPVWRRIEASGGRAGWFGRLAMAIYTLDARFARPQAIAVVLVASMLLGVGVAELRSRFEAREVDAEMAVRYLSMLDTNNR